MADNSIERPDTHLIDESLHDELEHALWRSPPTAKLKLLNTYYGPNEFGQSYSPDEIGISFNLYPRARQLKDKAIRKMRRFAISKELKSAYAN